MECCESPEVLLKIRGELGGPQSATNPNESRLGRGRSS